MATRKKKPAPAADADAAPVLPPGLPVRLLPHDWPFLYSVLANGDLVVNKRLPAPKPARKRLAKDGDDALM